MITGYIIENNLWAKEITFDEQRKNACKHLQTIEIDDKDMEFILRSSRETIVKLVNNLLKV